MITSGSAKTRVVVKSRKEGEEATDEAMKHSNPNAERPFRAPLYPFVPILGILSCLMLMFTLPVENWYRLGVWMVIGFALYFAYGYQHSHLRQQHEALAAAGDSRRR